MGVTYGDAGRARMPQVRVGAPRGGLRPSTDEFGRDGRRSAGDQGCGRWSISNYREPVSPVRDRRLWCVGLLARAHIERLIAMDERRPRRVEQVRLPPGPLAELKALLYELYTAAGEPPLTEIAAWVKEDDGLDGSPGRDTIHRLLREAQVPSSQADVVAVVTVLARVARWDSRHAADRVRDLWFAARTAQPLGTPLAEVTDPFSLEVHKPIQLTDH